MPGELHNSLFTSETTFAIKHASHNHSHFWFNIIYHFLHLIHPDVTSLEETNKDLEWDLFDLWNGKEEHYQDNGQRWSPWNTLLQKISRYTFRCENIFICICNTIIKWMMLWFSLRYGSCNHRDCEQVSIEIVMFNFALNFSALIQTEFWTGNIDGMGMGGCQLEEFPSLTRKYRRKAFKGTHLHFHWVLDVFKYKIYKFSPSSCLKLDLNVTYFCVH